MESDSRNNADVMTSVRELHQKFNRKLDEYLFIIQQQRDRIDYQQQRIDGQRFLIEELAWQVRDLRDSLRRSDEKLHTVLIRMNITQDEKYCPKCVEVSKTKDINPVQPEILTDSEALCESINFGSPPMPTRQEPIQKRNQKPFSTNEEENVNKNVERDINKYLDDCIPPPPATSPPNCDSDTDTDSVQISTDTFEKLNKLYEMSHFVRHSDIELNDSNEVVYRYKEMRDFSNRTKRGSSKTVWSSIPDCEVEYLPRVCEECIGANSIASNGQKSMQNKFLRQMSSEEVYI